MVNKQGQLLLASALYACSTSSSSAFTGVHVPLAKRQRSNLVEVHLTPRSPLEGESSSNKQTSLPVSNTYNEDMEGETNGPLAFIEEKLLPLNPFPSGWNSTMDKADVVCDQQVCAPVSPSLAMEGENSSDNVNIIDQVMNTYLGPRLLLAAVACLYGTNFPLGSIMDHALPASAATSARFVLASLALSPFVFKLHKDLIPAALFAGLFTATGYVAQSIALVDTSPATVSFLGAATVIWCPFLEWMVDKKPMSWNDRPQTWIAGAFCLLGVGILELCGSGGVAEAFATIGMGDALAILQAIGFGTGIFLSEKMMKKEPDQALSITSVLVATTAFISMLWALADGWMGATPGWESMTLPNLLLDPNMREVAFAVVWTGLLSTSLNFFLEVFALGKVPSGEASVVLASEPLWAAAFAAAILGESFGWNDYAGGFLIVAACLVNSAKASDIQRFLGGNNAVESSIGGDKP